MADNSYNHIPYVTVPMAQTHPDRLASVATLFGMEPAPVTGCRVLEVGCGTGINLIPMAYFLPGSHFTGVDLAEASIVEGRAIAAGLGLSNLDFVPMDLSQIGRALGEFDYIIAHGLYSWIPDDLRDRLFEVCRERLAPQGVALISYNALPGRHVRMMLREMMLYHTRNCADAGQRIEQARGLLQMVSQAQMFPPPWLPMIEEEITEMRSGDDGALFHDDLATVNDAFYVRDFVARAARHSLQYLGDSEVQLMFDPKNTLDWLGDDLIEREQYLDFLHFRRFRHTLLCRAEAKLQRPAAPTQMDHFLFSASSRRSEGQVQGLNPGDIPTEEEDVTRLTAALSEVYPLPIAFDKLLKYSGDREALRGTLFRMIRSGSAHLHVHDFASGAALSQRPRSSRLARWETAHTGVVTYSSHSVLRLDGISRRLVELLDGTREFDEIVAGLAQVEGGPPLEAIQGRLPQILVHMANTGLLEG